MIGLRPHFPLPQGDQVVAGGRAGQSENDTFAACARFFFKCKSQTGMFWGTAGKHRPDRKAPMVVAQSTKVPVCHVETGAPHQRSVSKDTKRPVVRPPCERLVQNFAPPFIADGGDQMRGRRITHASQVARSPAPHRPARRRCRPIQTKWVLHRKREFPTGRPSVSRCSSAATRR